MTLILSGPVRSGKTTRLMAWTSGRTDCGGVLSPDTETGRALLNVHTRETIPWQKPEADSPEDIFVGRFVFDRQAFKTAIGWLDAAIADPAIRYVILDEVGPLELSGRGWDAWLMANLPLPDGKELLLVIREHLVEEVIARYNLSPYQRIDAAEELM